jgi:hypothetical protein
MVIVKMVMTVTTILVRQVDESHIASSVLKHGKQVGQRRSREALEEKGSAEKEP